MNDNNSESNHKLGDPIFLDYDVNLTPIKIAHIEMLETIKEYFEKYGFENKGKTDDGFTIFKKITNKEKRKL